MGSGKSTLIALLMIVGLAQNASAKTFTVGGTTGWTLGIPPTFYDDWAKPFTFHAGDILVFPYPGSTHNVFEVNKADLASCNIAAPITQYDTVSGASVTLTAGSHYYICGIPGHCTANMKVTIVVAAVAPKTAPAPAKNSTVTPKLEAVPPAPVVGTSGASNHRSGPAIIVGAVLCVLASLLFQ